MINEHTPSPWYHIDFAGVYQICDEPYYEGNNLFDLEHFKNAEANAILSAAAPELLGALIEIVRISDRKHDAWDKAKAVIKKATQSPSKQIEDEK